METGDNQRKKSFGFLHVCIFWMLKRESPLIVAFSKQLIYHIHLLLSCLKSFDSYSMQSKKEKMIIKIINNLFKQFEEILDLIF
jgi:hypothetical protein